MAYYTVGQGDSPASVAGKVYGDQRMFAELMAANGGAPFRPGMVIYLPPKQDNPFVSNETAAAFGMATQGQTFTQKPSTLGINNTSSWTSEQLANRQAAYDVASGKYNTLTEALAANTGNVMGKAPTMNGKTVFTSDLPGGRDIGIPKPMGAVAKNTGFVTPQMSNYSAPAKAPVSGYQQALRNAKPGTSQPAPFVPGSRPQPNPIGQLLRGVGASQPVFNKGGTAATAMPSQLQLKGNAFQSFGGADAFSTSTSSTKAAQPKVITPQDQANISPQVIDIQNQIMNKQTPLISKDLIPEIAAASEMDGAELVSSLYKLGYTMDVSGNLVPKTQTAALPSLTDAASGNTDYTVPDNWWPGMFGLWDNNSYYGSQSTTYTGRPTGGGGQSVNSTVNGLLNMHVATG